MAAHRQQSMAHVAGTRRRAMTRSFSRRLTVVACIVAACADACGRKPDTTEDSARPATAPGSRALRVPSLPDLSRLEESLQQRIRTEYTNLAGDPGSSPDEDRAAAHGRVGMLLYAAEYTSAAEPFFTNARMLNPTDMRWPYYLGHLHRALQQLEQASTFFEEARRLQPDHVPSLVWLGETYLTLGRSDDAERHLGKAVELEPSSAAAWLGAGRAA